MTPICLDPSFDPDHLASCARDVDAIAGELLPLVLADDLAITDLRAAIAGFHECHVLALVMELSGMFAASGYTVDSVRAWMAQMTLQAAVT